MPSSAPKLDDERESVAVSNAAVEPAAAAAAAAVGIGKGAPSRSCAHGASLLFACGLALVLAGVGMHMAEFAAASPMAFRMRDMPITATMIAGMCLLPLGIVLCALAMRAAPDAAISPAAAASSPDALVRALARLPPGEAFAAFDGASFGRAHVLLCLVLTLTVVVDAMKPATLGFVMPGLKAEYKLTALVAAQFPTAALSGTAVGSVLWGLAADRFGRRPAIVVAALIFVATAVCAAMPTYSWNLAMCVFMGLSAGGMLPVVFTLLSEMAPAQLRGVALIAVGGVGSAGGYAALAGFSAWLTPITSWRVLWLLNVPTGLLVLLLMQAIPESPRFLLAAGRLAECAALLRYYRPGVSDAELVAAVDAQVDAALARAATAAPAAIAAATHPATAAGTLSASVVGSSPALSAAAGGTGEAAAHAPSLADEESAPTPATPLSVGESSQGTTTAAAAGVGVAGLLARVREFVAGPLALPTLAMALYAAAWGVCNNGFVLWLPTVLKAAGAKGVDAVLAYSSLISVLTVAPVALFYVRSTRWALVLCPAVMVLALCVLAGTGVGVAQQPELLQAMLALLLAANTATNAVLSAFSAEVFSTRYRGLGTGVIAGAGKVAGVFAPTITAAMAAAGESLRLPAVLTLVLMAATTAAVAATCPETRDLSLAAIQEMWQSRRAMTAARRAAAAKTASTPAVAPAASE